jgi:hypothetical protein
MFYPRWFAAALFVAGGLACNPDSSTPVGASPSPPLTQPEAAMEAQLRLERTARRMAVAMGNPEFRRHLRGRLALSRHREKKLELQQVLRENQNHALGRLARENGESENRIEEDLVAAGSLEIYLPLTEHRAGWKGTDDILVATSLRDGEVPVAFDVRGRRHLLDRTTPPDQPVLALLPAETDFSTEAIAPATCTPETCPEGGGGGTVPQAPRGIYLTQTHIIDLHEDWLRGAPEVEAMFMGPLSDTTSMNLIACANESNPAPRYYDQDKHSWTGNVLLADTLQLERVRSAYPPGTPWSLIRFTIAFWEDDTGRCQIATSVNTWKNKLLAAGLTVLGGMVVLSTDWTQAISTEAWPFIVQLPLGLLGLIGTIGGNDDFIGHVVNRSVWNPLHPDDVVFTNQVILDGNIRNGNAAIVWR